MRAEGGRRQRKAREAPSAADPRPAGSYSRVERLSQDFLVDPRHLLVRARKAMPRFVDSELRQVLDHKEVSDRVARFPEFAVCGDQCCSIFHA
jgi:hypothetical protein